MRLLLVASLIVFAIYRANSYKFLIDDEVLGRKCEVFSKILKTFVDKTERINENFVSFYVTEFTYDFDANCVIKNLMSDERVSVTGIGNKDVNVKFLKVDYFLLMIEMNRKDWVIK
jgi:hypothetical protein